MPTDVREIEPDAFALMVTEENLKVYGPSAGYQYAGKRGKNGWEVYKARAQPIGWLYQGRRVNTQDNAGGGALQIRIQIPSGVTARLISMSITGSASAGATLIAGVFDEDGNIQTRAAGIAAGASLISYLPSFGAVAANTNNIADTRGLILGPGQYLYAVSSAALQTETLTVGVVLLMSAAVEPTWDTTGSAGTPNLAASTISTANTLQAVYL